MEEIDSHQLEYLALESPWIHIEQKSKWEQILPLAQHRTFPKKSIIIHPGLLINHLYYLKSGEVKTLAINEAGQKKTIWYIQSGCIFGETSLINQKPCSYTFQAMTDCEVYQIDKETLYTKVLPQYPDVALNLIQTLARKVHVLSIQVEDWTFNKPLNRVAKLLYLLYKEREPDSTTDQPLPVTQEELADMLGVHRVTVNNVIRQFRKDGILKNEKFILIQDIEKLKGLGNLNYFG